MLLRTNLEILSKQFVVVCSENMNIVGAEGSTSKAYELKLEEEAKYLDRQLAGF